jgi:hypothetical protein
MPRFMISALILLAAVAPATAARRHHIVGRHPGANAAGMPITAERDSIRINSVGQVISQPVPVIQKEKNFNARAEHQLSAPPQTATPAPASPQQP